MLEYKNKLSLEHIEDFTRRKTEIKKDFECINSLLLLLPRAKNIDELVKCLREELSLVMDIESIDIKLEDISPSPKGRFFFSSYMRFDGADVARLDVLSKKAEGFSENDKDFLSRVSDLLSIYVSKLLRMSELADLKDKWESVFESISEPLLLLDKSLRILKSNKAFRTNFGDIESIKSFKAIKMQEVLDSGLPVSSTLELEDEKNYMACYYPVFRSDKTIDGLVIFYKDVTEQTMYKKGLLSSEKMAELGLIAGSIAHEISNPLGGILSYIQLMKSEVDEKQDVFLDLSEMEKAALRCSNIAKNLLHFSRSSKVEDEQNFNLVDLFKSVLPMLDMFIKNQNIELELEDTCPDTYLMGNFQDLVQAVFNLVSICVELLLTQSSSRKISIVFKESFDYVICEILCSSGKLSDKQTNNLRMFITERIIKNSSGLLSVGSSGFSVCLSKSS